MFVKIFLTLFVVIALFGLSLKGGLEWYALTLADDSPYHHLVDNFDGYWDIISGSLLSALAMTVQYYVIDWFVKKHNKYQKIVHN